MGCYQYVTKLIDKIPSHVYLEYPYGCCHNRIIEIACLGCYRAVIPRLWITKSWEQDSFLHRTPPWWFQGWERDPHVVLDQTFRYGLLYIWIYILHMYGSHYQWICQSEPCRRQRSEGSVQSYVACDVTFPSEPFNDPLATSNLYASSEKAGCGLLVSTDSSSYGWCTSVQWGCN